MSRGFVYKRRVRVSEEPVQPAVRGESALHRCARGGLWNFGRATY